MTTLANNQNTNAESQWISLAEAAQYTPYSAEYLSLLARKRRLVAKKVDGIWYTTRAILEDYLTQQIERAELLNKNPDTYRPFITSGGADVASDIPRSQEVEVSHPSEVATLPNAVRPSEEVESEAIKTSGLTNPTAEQAVFVDFMRKFNAHIDERVEQKRGLLSRVAQYIRNSYKTVFSSRKLLTMFVILLIVATLSPVRAVSGFAESFFANAVGAVKNAQTVMGFRPGTHANEILLLGPNGEVSIFGDVETEGQFRSFVQDGIAPIVVNSKTKVDNLNADFIDGLEITEFTLAFVTKNGNVTYENVYLEGEVEVGSTLLVKGATKLLNSLEVDGELSVLGDVNLSKNLTVQGSGTFKDMLIAPEILATEMLRTQGDLDVEGSVTASSGRITGTFRVQDSFHADGNVSLGSDGYVVRVTSEDWSVDNDGNAVFADVSGDAASFSSLSVGGTLSVGAFSVTDANATSTFVGAVSLNAGLADARGAIGSSGYVLQSTGTSTLWVATSSLGIVGGGGSGAVDSVNGQTGVVVLDTGDISENGNLYFTDARSRDTLSSSATGLSYATSTGIFSLTAGYTIPLSASTTEWATAYSWGDHSLQNYIQQNDNVAFGNATTTNLVVTNDITTSLNDGCVEVAGGVLTSTGSNCGTGSGGITNLNGLTASSQSFATSTSGGLSLNITSSGGVHTFTAGLTAGYTIPLSASTTQWATAYSWGNHSLVGYLTEVATTTVRNMFGAGTGLSYTDGVFTNTGVLSLGGQTGTIATSSLHVSTSTYSFTSGTSSVALSLNGFNSNDYLTLSAWNATTTDALDEGSSNQYFTTTRARDTLSSSATGLSYATSTGIFSLTAGYIIPLSASTTEWSSFFTTPSTRITAGTNIDWTGNTLNVDTDLANYSNTNTAFIDLTDLSSVATGLTYNNTNGQFSLTAGYNIPLTASTTAWNNTYNTVTAGSASWDAAAASTTALTPSYIRGLFSNSTTGLTYNSSTGATSLTAGYVIPLSASTTEWATAFGWGDHGAVGYLVASNNLSDLTSSSTARTNLGVDPAGTDNSTNVTLAGEDYLSLTGQEITANAINPDNLASADFGDFTCNGTTCSFDASTVSDNEIDYTTVTLNDFTFDVGNVSKTEFGYLDGVTSAIQTQLDSKLSTTTAASTYLTITTASSTYLHALNNLGDLTNTTTARTNLGLGSISLLNSIDVSANTNLGVTATGLELSGDNIALTAGYNIPLTASTTNWNNTYNTVTAGSASWDAAAASTTALTPSYIRNLFSNSTTGLTYDSGTGATSLTAGYTIPLTASTTAWNNTTNTVTAGATNWNTAFGWGNHSIVGYLTNITGESFLDLADTPSAFTANRLLYQTGSAVTDSANLTFNGSLFNVIGTASSTNLFTTNATTTRLVASTINAPSTGNLTIGAQGTGGRSVTIQGGDGAATTGGSVTVSGGAGTDFGDAGGDLFLRGGTGTDAGRIQFFYGSSFAAGFSRTGEFGIGTSTPSSALTVVGDTYITGALHDSTNSAGTTGMVLQTIGSGTAWVATSSLGISDGGITSLNGLTNVTQTFATGTATGIGLTISSSGSTHTLTPTVSSGYTIPLTASTTEWATAYSWGDHSTEGYLTTIASSTVRGMFSNTTTGLTYDSGTGTTSLTAGYIIPLSASTTEWSSFFTTPSTRITAGTNIDWTGNTLNVDTDLANYSNTNTAFIDLTDLSSVATGLTYNNTNGQFSLTSGYNIPLTASTTAWNNTYNTVTAGSASWDAAAASTTALTPSYLRGLFSNSTTGLTYNSSTGATSLTAGYTIPLSASTTQWATAYSWGDHGTVGYLTEVATTTVRGMFGAGTGLSYTDGVFTNTGVLSLGGQTGTIATSSLHVATSTYSFTSGTSSVALSLNGFNSNDYLTLSAWNATTTDALDEGSSNQYFTTARARDTLSSSATGLSYATSTGIFSLTAGYTIPLTASTTNWNTAFGWGNHSIVGYLTNITGESFLDLADTPSAFTANRLLYQTGSAVTDSANLTFNGSLFNVIGTASSTNLVSGNASTTNLTVSGNSYIGTVLSGAWQGTDIDISDYTNLGVTATGLELSGDNIALTAGYTIPLTASTTNWNNTYNTVTAGSASWDAASASTTALTPAYLRGLFSNSTTGLTYNSGTGATSLTAGYIIPLSASTTEWSSFFTTPSTRITAGTNIDWTGNTLNVDTDLANYSNTNTAFIDLTDLSSVATGLTYNNTNGQFSLTSGYTIPLTASTTEWATAYSWGDHSTEGYLTTIASSTVRGMFSNTTTGLTYDSGTGITSLTAGYVIPLSASTTEWANTRNIVNASSTLWDTAYSWGNHSIVGYLTNITGESFLDLADTPSAFTANRLLYQTGSAVTDSANLTFNGSLFNVIGTASSTNLFTTNATTTNLTTSGHATLATASSTNLTVSGNSYIGTVLSGAWQGSAIGVQYGGTGATTLTGLLIGNGTGAFTSTTTSAGLASIVSDETGSGALVFATSPAFTTPNLGTPSAATLTNATGLPVSTGISGLASGIATFLSTPSSANLISAVTDETGTGSLVFSAAPTFTGNTTLANASTTNLTVSGNSYLAGSGIWNSSGSVGIGTTTPASRLTVQGVGGSDNIFTLASSTGASLLTFTSTGRLGIGTSSPSHMLTVAGDINFTGALRTNGDAGTSGYILQSTGSGATWVATSTLGITGTSDGVASSSVAFSVHKGGTNQTVTTGAITLLTWSAEQFDTNNNFDLSTERFTPTVAGKYLVTLNVYCSDSTTYCEGFIYKNGNSYAAAYHPDSASIETVTTIIDMNGTTDYLEARAINSGGTTIYGGTTFTYFTGALIAPANGLAGGWSNDETQSYLADYTDLVAIGTTTAAAKLDVWGSDPTDDIFAVSSSTGSRLLTVTSAGNVGIGTTSPAYKLDINGGTDNGVLNIKSTDANSLIVFHDDTTPLNHVALGARGNNLVLYTGGTEKLTIDSTGNVGIGTTTPQYKLDIDGSNTALNLHVVGAGLFQSNDYGTIFQSLQTNSKRSTLFFYDETGAQTGRLGVDISGTDDDDLQFIAGSGSTPQLHIEADGNVGIGTTTPNNKLHVVGSGSIARLQGGAPGSSNASWLTFADSNNTATGYVGDDSSGNANIGLAALTSGAGLNFYVNNDAFSSMVVTSAGNVGIGTTTPANKLTVSSEDSVAAVISGTNVAGTYLELRSYGTSGGGFTGIGEVDGAFVVNTSGGEKLRVTSSGNVGIGTTTPAYQLSVMAPSSNVALQFGRTSTSVGYGAIGANVDNALIVHGFSGGTGALVQNLMVVQQTGKVGIGTASPSRKLDVQGTIAINASDASYTTSGWGRAVEMLESSVLMWKKGAGSYSRGIGKTNDDALYFMRSTANDNSAAAIYDMIISGSGNVGIGTAPSGNYVLEVKTGAVATGRGTKLSGNLMIGNSGGEYGSIGYNVRYTDTTGLHKYDASDKSSMLRFGDSGGVAMRVYSTGTVGTAGNTISYTAGPYVADGGASWTSASDLRLKDNVDTLSVLDRLDEYRAVEFDWKQSGVHDLGVIAQELYKVFPEAVFVGNDPTNPLGINEEGAWGVQYDKLSAVALQGVKELNLKLEDLASSTAATSTLNIDGDEEPTFVGRFFARLVEWFADSANGIGNFFANRVSTMELCVGDESGAETCITKSQLDSLLQSAAAGSAGGSSSGGGGSTPAPEPEPPVDTTTEPDPTTGDTTASTTPDGTTDTPPSDGGTVTEPEPTPEPDPEPELTPEPEPEPTPEPEPAV